MAKQTKQLIQDTGKDLLEIERQLESAKKDRDKLTKQISSAKSRLTKKRNDTKNPEKVINAIIREFKNLKLLSSIVIKEIDTATEINTEFSHPAYLRPLYRVANNNDLYKFIRTGSGWDTRMKIQIVFEEMAGTIDDWAEGILSYREALGVDEGDEEQNRGKKATFYWLNNVFGTSKEAQTIRGRLQGSAAIAPFWNILDQGSQPMASDRSDGSFNPIIASPTGFVEESERRATNLFKVYFDDEKRIWFAEIQELEKEIDRAEQLRQDYNYDISQLRPEAEANRRIYDSFGDKKVYIDENKLADAVRRLRADEGFDRSTVELTKRGSPYRVRPTVRRLEGLI